MISVQGLTLDAHLNSQRPSAANARTQPVCPFSSTLSCISDAGGSHTAMLFAALPQNTCSKDAQSASDNAFMKYINETQDGHHPYPMQSLLWLRSLLLDLNHCCAFELRCVGWHMQGTGSDLEGMQHLLPVIWCCRV